LILETPAGVPASLSPRWRLFFLSFLMLFVELALIRWTGSNVVYLSYFSNFVLLASFLGIGIGFLRAQARLDLFAWVPAMLAGVVVFVSIFPVEVSCGGSQVIYFGCNPSGLPVWLTLPAIFMAVAIIMASIGQGVARTFAAFEPLEAYRLDILGSLAGIAGFSTLSFLGAPPIAWGTLVSVLLLILYRPSIKLIQVVALGVIVVVLGKESLGSEYSWSPYYKIRVFEDGPGVYGLNVNGIPHQTIESRAERHRTEPWYFVPYQRIQSNPLNDVLIVGGGNGGDVAIALAAGAKHIDAVEIDPRIYQIGRAMNPDHPYQDPRVTIHIDDGRAFLERTKKNYDLILFALPDSLTLVSGQSSLRLESYLFTLESIRTAREHLNPGGAFGMYNLYRKKWLLDRLANTLQVAYGYPPCLDSNSGAAGAFSVLTIGRDRGNVRCALTWVPLVQPVAAPSSDDHPFLYLQTPSIPDIYLIAIASILLLSLVLVRSAAGPFVQMRNYLDLFFMGAAFLLLETKSVVQFALLFGTTWFVNALVFFGVLVSVLIAIEIVRRFSFRQPAPLYAALFASLAFAWLIPLETLLAFDVPLRFCGAVILTFTPILLANLIFAGRFREVGASTDAFAANLLGAMAGGLLEYSSLVLGYRNMLPLIGLLYALAFLLEWRRSGEEAPQPLQSTALNT
jgi:spermidine synthase